MCLFSSDKEFGLDMLTLEVPIVFLLLFSLFMVDFIVKKNDFMQQNDFTLLFVTIFLGLFPDIFAHLNIVCIYVLVLLAFRRIISLRTLNSTKQKLFDASLYIALAVLFDSWMILYLFIIYMSILVYVSNDYRNWLVPIVSFLGILFIYTTSLYLTSENILTDSLFQFDIKINYSTTGYRRILLHVLITSLFSINFIIFFLKYKTYSSQKKVSFLLIKALFFIGVGYVLFAKKGIQNTEIVLLFPLAILMANLLGNIENKRIGDILLFSLLIVGFLVNFFLK
ncbi:hypothetical protein [Kordia antarctica]|nr:hypothetical protein [Kordia antarctica]